jgi:hypothetical protein
VNYGLSFAIDNAGMENHDANNQEIYTLTYPRCMTQYFSTTRISEKKHPGSMGNVLRFSFETPRNMIGYTGLIQISSEFTSEPLKSGDESAKLNLWIFHLNF